MASTSAAAKMYTVHMMSCSAKPPTNASTWSNCIVRCMHVKGHVSGQSQAAEPNWHEAIETHDAGTAVAQQVGADSGTAA